MGTVNFGDSMKKGRDPVGVAALVIHLVAMQGIPVWGRTESVLNL
jgi:hypothetical protein